MKSRTIKTDAFSATLRERAVDITGQRLLVTNFSGSQQAHDFTEPANCGGFGRIRHFRRISSGDWPRNPLPIDPACRALGLDERDGLRAQMFQNAACNWRCWYCFVDFTLLSADPKRSSMLSATELVELYLAEPNQPLMIDLTEGQPDLVPEWVPWMMRELQIRGLDRRIYLWSDDNLSNDYFWRYLTAQDHDLIANYPNYGKVGCFKGFDAASFAFNTKADASLFDRQFELMERMLTLGIDQYAYATFTTPDDTDIRSKMARFVDRLQSLDEYLPLRTIPLEIQVFTPVAKRNITDLGAILLNQQRAIESWQEEMQDRFSEDERKQPITGVPLKYRRSRA
jgi:uncharacterized Fe-S cluster-containing radical SAM superfamily protein